MARHLMIVVGQILLITHFAGAEITGSMALPAGFAEGLNQIAIVTEVCVPALDCLAVENQAFASLKRADPLPFRVESPKLTRAKLMEAGLLEYDADRARELALHLGVEGFLVIRVLAAEREANVFTGSKSRVRIELYLLDAVRGRIVARGGASGLALAAGTPIDRATLKAVERALEDRETVAQLRAESRRKSGN